MVNLNRTYFIILFTISISGSFPLVFADGLNTIQILPTDDTIVISDLNDPDDVQGFKKIISGDLNILPVTYSWNFNDTPQQLVSPAYLKFDLSGIDYGEIQSATLQLYAQEIKTVSNTAVSVFSIDDILWDESNLSFENVPLFNQTLSAVNVVGPGWYEWDVTQYVKDNADSTISLALMFDNLQDNQEELIIFVSKESQDSSLTPILLIETQPSESSNKTTLIPTDDTFLTVDVNNIDDPLGLHELKAGDDDFINIWYANNVTSNQEYLVSYGVMKFDLSEILLEDVANVNLKMKTMRVGSTGGDKIISVYDLNNTNWNESTLTHATNPGFDSTLLDTIEISRPNIWHSWNISNIFKENNNSEISLGLNYDMFYSGHEEQTVFYSKESKFPPYLEITFKEKKENELKQSSTEEGGGCLIATAAYDSEMAPQVQQLRELRDNHLLQTSSGTVFMTLFNSLYYSFSPIISDWERENPVFQETVRLFITPLISSLSLLNHAVLDSESAVLGYGLSIIALNVGIYFVSPFIGFKIVKRLVFRRSKIHN